MKKLLFFMFLLVLLACQRKTAPLGSPDNPIKMYFVPSVEVSTIVKNADTLKTYLEKTTGYSYKIAVPSSYAAVVEAMGANEADMAWLATFAYVLAHEKYGAEVALTTVRKGLKDYRGQFIAHVDSKINALKDISGKSIAYTDAGSTSGYLYPSSMLKLMGIEPSNVAFVGGHPQAVLAVYQKRTDVGCCYWSPEKDGVFQDARQLVKATYPDIFEKVKVIGFTDWIPNDTVTFRKGFPQNMKENIVNALLAFVRTDEGKRTMDSLYNIDGLVRAKDADYDVVRTTLKTLGKDIKEMVK